VGLGQLKRFIVTLGDDQKLDRWWVVIESLEKSESRQQFLAQAKDLHDEGR
jgi:hypothetical protein